MCTIFFFSFQKMGRTYHRKTQRGSYGLQNLTEALKAIADGMPLNTVSETFKIPAKTLWRHRDTKVQNPGSLVLGRYRSDFSKDQELDLVELITKMEQSLFGLSTLDVRKLAYEFATKLGIKHRFNTEARMAGRDWLYGFLTRHPRLSIRKPQSFSISRLVGFNRPQVSAFFTIYMNLLNCHNFTPDKIWNMDETGISTVQKPVKNYWQQRNSTSWQGDKCRAWSDCYSFMCHECCWNIYSSNIHISKEKNGGFLDEWLCPCI